MKLFHAIFSCVLALQFSYAQDVFDAAFFAKSQEEQTAKSEKMQEEAFALYSAKKLRPAANKIYAANLLDAFAKHAQNAPAEMKAWLMSDSALLEEIVLQIKPQDKLDKAFGILSEIWKASPEDFKSFPRLAVAIAIVFDAQPPKEWPHHQVSEKVLPRILPEPMKAFSMWVNFRKKNRLLLQPEKLSIEELKYVVSSLGTEEDKEYAQKSVSTNLSTMAKLYASINYDTPRYNDKIFDWPKDDYSLKTIKRLGGICVDQAYYTTEVIKARGVPSFILSGAGADGFHAWCAYMTRPGAWNFGVGRYEGARFVTGTTFDPQTWEKASDHDLESLRENFRSNPRYTDNVIHTYFAKKFLGLDKFDEAKNAAEEAIKLDGRNSDSWDILLQSAAKSNADSKAIAEIYTRAIKAFSKSPDLDAAYRRKLIAICNSNGDKLGARRLSTSIILKTKQLRPDIAMEFALRDMNEDLESGDMKSAYASYKSTLSMFKNDAAIALKNITFPVVDKMFEKNLKKESIEIVKITKKVLKGDAVFMGNIENLEKWVNEHQ